MRGTLSIKTVVVMVSFFASISIANAAQNGKTSDTQVKKAIIKESIAEYPGKCPCPYSVARNGSICGRRSAYSRPGGYEPICYDRDINQKMIVEWRSTHSEP